MSQRTRPKRRKQSPLTLTANKLHDDYIYDEKVMRGHTTQKNQGPKENSANIAG
jgi:hypothetical protein